MGRPQIVHANGYTIETVFGLGGAPVRVNIDGPVGEIVRRDRRYGALLERSRLDGVDVWERRIPGPGGTWRSEPGSAISAGPTRSPGTRP